MTTSRILRPAMVILTGTALVTVLVPLALFYGLVFGVLWAAMCAKPRPWV